jgi:2-oxoglutarate dehydrogenase E2 component (dihydrolipoamide succinyltransferase)
MARARKLLLTSAAVLSSLIVTMPAALAQTPVDPSTTPVENNGGWVFSMAQLLTILGILVVVITVILYMRYAPRFARDEESLKVVHADRVRPGQEPPRRAVDLSQAAPVVVAPPAVPVAVAAVAAPAPMAPAQAAAAPAAPAAAPAPSAAAPAAPAPAAAAPAPAAPAPAAPAAPAERAEVTMDQEAYEAKLAELLEAGTDKRVAEGQARRAGMIAARKKAEG